MFKTKTFFLFLIISSLTYCQESDVLAKFIITDATSNGTNITQQILKEKAFIVFYHNQDDKELAMANVWPKSNTQSYGRTYGMTHKELKNSISDYKKDIFNFNWAYSNSYDEKKGTAKVELQKIYKPQGVAFVITIIPEDLDILIYKGYLEGSVDFSSFR